MIRHDTPTTTPWWGAALALSLATAAICAGAPGAWQGAGTAPIRTVLVMLQQVALMVLCMLTWAAPQLSGFRHRFAARAAATGIALQLAASIWTHQIAAGLGDHAGTVHLGRTVLGGLGGTCLVVVVAALTRRHWRQDGGDGHAVADAALLGASAAVATWHLLMVGVAHGRLAFAPVAAGTIAVAVVTGILAWLVLSAAAWGLVAFRLLVGACVLSLVVALQYAGGAVANDAAGADRPQVVALLVCGLVAGAVLHPSFGRLVDDRRPAPAAPHWIARAMTLCAAVVLPPAMSVLRVVAPAHDDGGGAAAALSAPPAVAGALIALGVSWRLTRLLRERDRTHRMLRHWRLHDDLTGLPNRACLLERLGRELDRLRTSPANAGAGFGLMLIDLDRFRSINDAYGHQAGDAVLVDVAHRLVHTVRTDDVVGRMSGDEFVLLCGEPWDEAALHQLAERLRAAVEAPLPAEFGVVTPKVSIGIVAVDGETAAEDHAVRIILQQADARLREAKAASRASANPMTDRRTAPPETSAADHDDKPRVS